MNRDPTARSWEALARREPHWAVFTDERFLRRNLTAEALAEFSRSGETHLARVLSTIREKVDPGFVPRIALDYGCGVGRVLVPLAAACESVVGIDVSETMLREAAQECERKGIANVRLLRPEEMHALAAGSIDLVHAWIVFQHMHPRQGKAILPELMRLLAPRGVAVLQFTYSDKHQKPRWRAHLARRLDDLKNRFLPFMRMHEYDLSSVFRILQESGIERMHAEFTDHDFYGLLIYAQKP